ncbi:MAG: alpha/beta hydrolase [Pseudomonadota bacterium]
MREAEIDAGPLRIAYREYGSADGWPCIMGHGFPYDVEAYADVGPLLAEAGARVLVPWLRGYGGTRFKPHLTMRSGEQAVLGGDMLALMDALGIERAVLGGYDWGGRAACIVAALWPDRVAGLVTGNAYNIFDHAKANEPLPAKMEVALWYQYFFHSERGRRALIEDRRDVCRTLWQMWSPSWGFSDVDFTASARSFDNPDFVDVVIHSYRHRYGLVPGDPAVAHIETRLTAQPVITVPTIAIDGEVDGVRGPTGGNPDKFSGPYDYRIWPDAGHNLPQEKPGDWVQAVLDVRAMGDTGLAGAGPLP